MVGRFEAFIRGWLAITFVSQVGLAVQHMRNPAVLQKSFAGADGEKSSLALELFVLQCIQQAVLRGALLLTDSLPLHAFNGAMSAVYFIFLGMHVFLHDQFFSIEILVQAGFAVITTLLSTAYIVHVSALAFDAEEERAKRPRKVISKHFLEAHVSDYDPQSRKRK